MNYQLHFKYLILIYSYLQNYLEFTKQREEKYILILYWFWFYIDKEEYLNIFMQVYVIKLKVTNSLQKYFYAKWIIKLIKQ